jgi:Fe2+ transport system protein FeoA
MNKCLTVTHQTNFCRLLSYLSIRYSQLGFRRPRGIKVEHLGPGPAPLSRKLERLSHVLAPQSLNSISIVRYNIILSKFWT